MKLVQDGLEAGQHGTVQFDRERSLETRLVLGLGQETLELDELDLQMQLPSKRHQRRMQILIHQHHSHCHELDNRLVEMAVRRAGQQVRDLGRFAVLDLPNVGGRP